jgi:tetratricopeptide (TPR) repeat protein
MRALLCYFAIAVVVALAIPASADTDVVILGPAASGKVAAATLTQVKSLLLRSGVGTAVDRKIDAACAADPACLAKAGSELTAQRVLAVTVAQPTKGNTTIGVSLVDVVGKEMVAVRDIPLADRKVARELVPAIKKFLEEAPTDRAKALFAEGNQHFNLNEYDQALELYKRAYRIRPLPAFLFNMAQCNRKLGHYQDAINNYQSYLVGVPDASNKEMVESLINESKQLAGDEQKRKTDQALLNADVEKKRLEAEKQKAEEGRKASEARAQAESERRKTEEARIAHEKATYDRHPMRKWMIMTSILAAGTIGGGAYFGTQSKHLQESYDNAGCGDPAQYPLLPKATIDKCKSDRSTGQTDATLANALMIGGGAALLGSILIFAIDPGNVSRPETPRTSLRIAPNSVQVVLTW